MFGNLAKLLCHAVIVGN